MEQVYQVYIAILVFSALLAAGMLARLWQLRKTPGANGLMAAIFFVAVWSLAYIMEISALPIEEKIFWAKVQFIGIPFAPIGLFIFALHYSGRAAWLTRLRIFLLLAPAIITVGLAFSNEAHGQIWRAMALTGNQPFGPLNLTHGTWFYAFSLYLYILVLLTTVFFFQVAMQGNRLYQRQSRLMLAGMMAPWVANFLYITRLSPTASLDLTPVALTLTNLALSVAFARYRLVDILPVAHSTLFNAMSDGILVLDHQVRVVDINPSGQHILGTNQAILGVPVEDILPWRQWQEQDSTDLSACELHLEDGRAYEVHITPILDSKNQPGGQLLVLTDISTLKQANRQISEVSEMKTKLLANVSHDFRSPLGAIIGYAEMLKADMFGPQNAEQKSATNEILDSANQLLAFANNLIGQAQIETGKIVIRNRPFSPAEITESIFATLHFHAAKKNLDFTQDIDPSLPEQLMGDIYWLRQIVVNLLHNAVKFTSEGGVRLAFKCHNADHWAIEVSDDGVGIPQDEQARIFEAFEQAESPSTRKHAGSGLGLSIVRELTRLMDGKIELESEPGKGSTFRVVLPLIPV
jgi:signal transduction histidine kinase